MPKFLKFDHNCLIYSHKQAEKGSFFYMLTLLLIPPPQRGSIPPSGLVYTLIPLGRAPGGIIKVIYEDLLVNLWAKTARKGAVFHVFETFANLATPERVHTPVMTQIHCKDASINETLRFRLKQAYVALLYP